MKHNLTYSHTNKFDDEGNYHVLFTIGDFLFWFAFENNQFISVKAESEEDMVEHYDDCGKIIEPSNELWDEQVLIAKEIKQNISDYMPTIEKYAFTI